MSQHNICSFAIGNTVFISKTEEFWDKPFTMKRHHIYNTRTVILRCKVVDIRGDEFKAELQNNNGFDKDGQTFVFNKGILLANQDFSEYSSLGVWKTN